MPTLFAAVAEGRRGGVAHVASSLRVHRYIYSHGGSSCDLAAARNGSAATRLLPHEHRALAYARVHLERKQGPLKRCRVRSPLLAIQLGIFGLGELSSGTCRSIGSRRHLVRRNFFPNKYPARELGRTVRATFVINRQKAALKELRLSAFCLVPGRATMKH